MSDLSCAPNVEGRFGRKARSMGRRGRQTGAASLEKVRRKRGAQQELSTSTSRSVCVRFSGLLDLSKRWICAWQNVRVPFDRMRCVLGF